MAEKKNPEVFIIDVQAVNPFVVLLEDYQRAGQSISCKCSKCGFPGNGVWKPMPQTLLKPNACPVCAGRTLNALFKGFNDLKTWCDTNGRTDILDDWDYVENENDHATPDRPDDIARSNSKTQCHWRCHACGTHWLATPNKRTTPDKRTHNTTSCPRCSKAGTSFTELALIYYLRMLFSDLLIHDTQLIGRELDIVIPSHNIAVECDGYLYHKDKLDADNIKDTLCKNKGVSLFRFRDSRLPATDYAKIITCNGIQDTANFESAIKDLLVLCGATQLPDINTKRDYGSIITNYKRTVLEHSLLNEHPDIANEWHPIKNGALKPQNFSSGEDYYAWWKCSKCGHEWQAHIYSRTLNKTGCPKCRLIQQGQTYRRNKALKMNLERWCNENNMGELLLDWDYVENENDPACPDNPKDCPYGSPRDVHWKCHICGNQWKAAPANRRLRRGECKKCRGKLLLPGQNDLKTWCLSNHKQYLLDDWDYPKNKADMSCPDLPEEVRYNQAIQVHWICHICGNEWQEDVYSRSCNNRQCRNCAIMIRSMKRQKKVRNIDTGEVFDSISEAELKTSGKKGTSIIACCKGIHKTAYGFHWEYVLEK